MSTSIQGARAPRNRDTKEREHEGLGYQEQPAGGSPETAFNDPNPGDSAVFPPRLTSTPRSTGAYTPGERAPNEHEHPRGRSTKG